jgi:hypothetical protein
VAAEPETPETYASRRFLMKSGAITEAATVHPSLLMEF